MLAPILKGLKWVVPLAYSMSFGAEPPRVGGPADPGSKYTVLLPPLAQPQAGLEQLKEGLRASLGAVPYTVVELRPPGLGRASRVIVVLDFASSSPMLSECMHSGLRSVWSRLVENSRAEAYCSMGRSSSSTGISVPFGGQSYLLFPSGQDGAATGPGGYAGGRSSWRVEEYQLERSRRAFYGLLKALAESPGPHPVIWVSESFRWFQTRTIDIEESPFSRAIEDPFPDVVALTAELVSSGGVSVFPVLYSSSRGNEAKSAERRQAAALAAATGGSPVYIGDSDSIGETILSLVSTLQQSAAVDLSGPPVGRRLGWHAQRLKLWFASRPNELLVDRPFVTARDPSFKRLDSARLLNLAPPLRLLMRSERLFGKFGCAASGDDDSNVSITVRVPSWVLRQSPAEVHYFVEGMGDAGKSLGRALKSRGTVTFADNSNSPDPGTEFAYGCLRFPREERQRLGRVIVFSPAAGWAAVGELDRSGR